MRCHKIVIVIFSLFAFSNFSLASYPSANIKNVISSKLDGPAHHGFIVETTGLNDPNLSYYEVQVKPDVPYPAPPWSVYSTTIKPFDSALITIPYRNDKIGIPADQKYCVKVRAVYADSITPWVDKCGITLIVPDALVGDSDGDTLSDFQEYALGIDPQSFDTDGDGMPDGLEFANTTDPNKPLYPDLTIVATSLDFGLGDHFGKYPNQHKFIAIKNYGDDPAVIESIKISDPSFVAGAFPQILSNIPPKNIARIPISFLPSKRGNVQAEVEIVTNDPKPLPKILLKGTGINIPDCFVSPELLDFGTVSVSDQSVSLKDITISNEPVAGDPVPNVNTPFGFTISSSKIGIAPGVRGLILPQGRSITIPVLFQHRTKGDYAGTVTIRSAQCGLQSVRVKAVAE